MFCYQCQETMAQKGCTQAGVCGKKEDLAAAQDLLIWVTKGLGALTTRLRREKKEIPGSVNRQFRRNLCMTQTNTNFDTEAILEAVRITLALRREWYAQAEDTKELPDASRWDGDPDAYGTMSEVTGIMACGNTDIRCFRELITYACKGIAAMTEQADSLGMQDTDIDIFLQRAMGQTLDDRLSGGNLLALTMEAGRYSVRSMDLLYRARIARFGDPVPAEVPCGGGGRPGILVTGTGMQDLYRLLEQTAECGVDVYTHGELLPAYAYPELRKYPHFAGHYGGSWQNQKETFESFHGPVLATSEGVFLPRPSYRDRLFTTGCAGIPGCVHIPETENGEKDFSAVIERAKACDAPCIQEKTVRLTGYGYRELSALTDEIVSALQDGRISRIAAVIGDDGRAKKRVYYTDLLKALPQDALVLTAGSVQYRFENAASGERTGGAAGTLPRILSAGELADTYSVIQLALRLREMTGVDSLNQLPLSWFLSWHGQRSAAVLLGLLYLDIRRIRFGPGWPAFMRGNMHAVFSEYFGMCETGTVQQDIESVFGASDALITADMIIGDIVDQYPSLIPVMAERGLHCIGCGVSRMETLAEACMVHALDVYDFLNVLNAHLSGGIPGTRET